MQRNFRPPVWTSIKCFGLPHLEQPGGGEFFGMAVTLDQARANNSQSPKIAGDGAVMAKAYGDDYRFVCRVSDVGRQIIAFAHRQFPGRRVPPGDGVTGWTISGLAVPGAIVAVRISGI
jgi:hypothetical protein